MRTGPAGPRAQPRSRVGSVGGRSAPPAPAGRRPAASGSAMIVPRSAGHGRLSAKSLVGSVTAAQEPVRSPDAAALGDEPGASVRIAGAGARSALRTGEPSARGQAISPSTAPERSNPTAVRSRSRRPGRAPGMLTTGHRPGPSPDAVQAGDDRFEIPVAGAGQSLELGVERCEARLDVRRHVHPGDVPLDQGPEAGSAEEVDDEVDEQRLVAGHRRESRRGRGCGRPRSRWSAGARWSRRARCGTSRPARRRPRRPGIGPWVDPRRGGGVHVAVGGGDVDDEVPRSSRSTDRSMSAGGQGDVGEPDVRAIRSVPSSAKTCWWRPGGTRSRPAGPSCAASRRSRRPRSRRPRARRHGAWRGRSPRRWA